MKFKTIFLFLNAMKAGENSTNKAIDASSSFNKLETLINSCVEGIKIAEQSISTLRKERKTNISYFELEIESKLLANLFKKHNEFKNKLIESRICEKSTKKIFISLIKDRRFYNTCDEIDLSKQSRMNGGSLSILRILEVIKCNIRDLCELRGVSDPEKEIINHQLRSLLNSISEIMKLYKELGLINETHGNFKIINQLIEENFSMLSPKNDLNENVNTKLTVLNPKDDISLPATSSHSEANSSSSLIDETRQSHSPLTPFHGYQDTLVLNRRDWRRSRIGWKTN